MLLAAAGVVTAALAVRKSSTVAAPISRSVKARKPGGDSVSLAFLGCGSIANHHLSAVISSGAGVVRALCDPNTANRDNLRARIQSETDWESPLEFRSLEEALTSSACEFDAVAILVPNHLHESTALAAIAAGKHVLLEKPIALDVAGGQRIISAAEAAGVVCWVAENAAFWHEVRDAFRKHQRRGVWHAGILCDRECPRRFWSRSP
jgi:Oxidoreductase family, NAD-binding Rossmann fold